jgi:uncharacterized membrane protein
MAGENRSRDPHLFFTVAEKLQIAKAIGQAELGTSGEIRLRVERRCPGDPLEHCKELMKPLGIQKTVGRTGVLVYISIEDHQAAVYGDRAIHEVIGDNGWVEICNRMRERFKKDEFCDGVCEAITGIGQVLSRAFPSKEGDVNELPNEPSIED